MKPSRLTPVLISLFGILSLSASVEAQMGAGTRGLDQGSFLSDDSSQGVSAPMLDDRALEEQRRQAELEKVRRAREE